MKTTHQIAKIKAVLLYILQNCREGLDYIKLFKIIYFAQQSHLVTYGKVIVEDSFRALKHGPVPSYTYKALQIAEGKPLEGDFTDFLKGIEVKDKKVYSTETPDLDWLSGADRRSLNAAIARYKDTDPFELSELSHDEAWQEAIRRMQDDPQKNIMTLIDIARAGHASAEMVNYIREKQILKYALA